MPTTSPATSTMLPEVLLDTPTCSPTGCLNISNPETHDLLVNTLGGCVVETLISCILYDVLIVQAYSYFRDFERDLLPLKGLVLATSFLESIQFLCDIHQTYQYAIISSYALLIGDISSMQHISWSVYLANVVQLLTVALVHGGFSLTIAITFAHFGNSMIFYGFGNFSTQVYGNALLGLLNARSVLRSKNDTYHFSVGADGVELAQLRPMRIEIFRETSQITVVDELVGNFALELWTI
ncbi:hypothetical protein K474DRAFT_1710903 [Panus rudis PR-1116 ss-1]|nr:hypothetical protein K474DRAFT_1710903 [Panus rudis PR-1116 ss-1]